MVDAEIHRNDQESSLWGNPEKGDPNTGIYPGMTLRDASGRKRDPSFDYPPADGILSSLKPSVVHSNDKIRSISKEPEDLRRSVYYGNTGNLPNSGATQVKAVQRQETPKRNFPL